MADTAVDTECLADIDREKIVATIVDARTSHETTGDSEQQDFELQLDESVEAQSTDALDEKDGCVKDNVQIELEAEFDPGVQAASNSVDQTDFGVTTSPEISSTDAKESPDANESGDLVTITVLEKTEEEKHEEVLNGEDPIVIVNPEVASPISSAVPLDESHEVADSIGNDELGGTELPADSTCSNSNEDRTQLPDSSPDGIAGKPDDAAAPVVVASIHSETTAPSTQTTNAGESGERFLIINSNSSPEQTTANGETALLQSNADLPQTSEQIEVPVDEEAIVPNPMGDDKYKEIEILVAAFDGLDENSSNQSGNDQASVSPETVQPSLPSQEAEVPSATPERKPLAKVPTEPKSERKLPKAKRSAGPPTRRESSNASDKAEIPIVVGNGKLRVHGYEKLSEQTGLPELVLVNREILERIISDQEKTITQTKNKLKEMCKMCDDLRKVVLSKGLNTVLSPEEAKLPVDVVIKMQKLPPHVPTFQTVKVARTANGNYDLHAEGRFYNRVLPVKKWLGVAHAPKPATPLALGANRKITSDSKCKVEFNIKVLPKDIVRALTNGDVLTVQQRQRFIDKITVDIIKAKGVPQPQQIQEIAMQVANMYPRSLVILPEGKRKSSLRKRGRADDDDEESAKANVPKRTKKDSLAKAAVAAAATAAESPAGASPKPLTPGSPNDPATTPGTKRGRGRPARNRTPGVSPDPKSLTKTAQAAPLSAVPKLEAGSDPTAAVNGTSTPVLKKKGGRPRKAVAPEPNPRHVEEEQALSLEEQKTWLQEDVKKPIEQQDDAKQLRLLHNCYDMLYQEMAANNYDCAATIAEWPVLRKPEHVLSVFKRLKKVHGRFQEAMRKDAPKLVTFLHERVNTDEGAEWSLQISQAKLSDRYQLPEEVGVMPLLALNFEEDFSLLFKLVPDKEAFDDAIKHVEPVPIIIGVGESIFNCHYHVVVERQLLYSPKTYLDALELVYAAYFVFNLAYPKELLNMFEYVQRYYVGYNPPIKMVTLSHTRPKIALFLKKLKDFERLDWNSNIRANSPGVPSEFERESDPEGDDMDASETVPEVKHEQKNRNLSPNNPPETNRIQPRKMI
ncbi:uncharacterized protein LOC100907281 [Galendromus occidentalis]|uniref:Uncharacterized protein LOC100907281 n=1 Tax=Galendromus occidentalis TaxID=34638 RepID=A0AAJ7SG79_9ACAR|nr:uncharacterized protein LOC100907281 [Galendromus occidentalis]